MVLHPLKTSRATSGEFLSLLIISITIHRVPRTSTFSFSAAVSVLYPPVRRGQPSSSASTNANKSFRLGRVNFFGHFSSAGHHGGAQLPRFKTHVEQGTMRTFQLFDEKDVRHYKRIIETEHGRHESPCLDIDQDIRITYQKQQYCPPGLVSPGRPSMTFPSIPQLWIPLCSPLREHEKATLRIRGLFRPDTACPARSHAIH